MSIAELHHLLNAWGMPRIPGHGHIYELRKSRWPIFFRTRQLHERQIQVLRMVRTESWTPYVYYDEDPKDWELTGSWIQCGTNTWTVPQEQSSSDLLDGFLNAGGWTIYLASFPLTSVSIPDFFDNDTSDAADFIRSHSIPALIQAFFDNSEWRIALEPAVEPMVTAA